MVSAGASRSSVFLSDIRRKHFGRPKCFLRMFHNLRCFCQTTIESVSVLSSRAVCFANWDQLRQTQSCIWCFDTQLWKMFWPLFESSLLRKLGPTAAMKSCADVFVRQLWKTFGHLFGSSLLCKLGPATVGSVLHLAFVGQQWERFVRQLWKVFLSSLREQFAKQTGTNYRKCFSGSCRVGIVFWLTEQLNI
jgi:hypothetical protein